MASSNGVDSKKARVQIVLDPIAEDAPGWWLPNGSRSLVYRFGSGARQASFGAWTFAEEVDRIEPGSEFVATLEFWASEEVDSFLQEGARFVVCYPRPKGQGVVLEVQ